MTDPVKGPKMFDRSFAALGFKYNRWQADLEENLTLEHALVPAFWSHVAPKIMGHDKTNPRGRGDIIELRQLSTGLYAELLVTEIMPGFVKVAVIRGHAPEDVEVSEGSPFETRWNVGKRGHEVIRKADKQIMAGPFQTKESAIAWIDDHMSKIAA